MRLFPVLGNKKGLSGRVEQWLNRDRLAQFLLSKSHFAKRDFQALLLHAWSENLTFESMGKLLGIQRPGAWKRWRRAVDAIFRSFCTIELSLYAGALDPKIAELLIQDLQDYVDLVQQGERPERIRERLELRMIELLRLQGRRS